MKDSGFFVPQEKRSRFAVNYGAGPDGQLKPVNPGGSTPTDYSAQPTVPSGGGGMMTTAEQLRRFFSIRPGAGMLDGKGTFFWDGAAGTWFWVDPTNDVVFVAMIQRMTHPDNHSLEYRSHAAVYSALIDPSK